MQSRIPGLFNATAATLLVVGIGTAIVGPLVYFIVVFAEGLLESVGLVATGWGGSHGGAFLWIAAAVIVGPALWAAWRYFQGALRAEDEMRGGDAPPAV